MLRCCCAHQQRRHAASSTDGSRFTLSHPVDDAVLEGMTELSYESAPRYRQNPFEDSGEQIVGAAWDDPASVSGRDLAQHPELGHSWENSKRNTKREKQEKKKSTRELKLEKYSKRKVTDCRGNGNRVLDLGLSRHSQDDVRRRLASSRDRRLPMVLLRTLFREQAEQGDDELLALLPKERWEERSVEKLEELGFTKADVGLYLDILRGTSDEERCNILLQADKRIPTFLFMFLIRSGARIYDAQLVGRLLGYWQQHYCTREEATGQALEEVNSSSALQKVMARELEEIMRSLSVHCLRTDPRLSLRLADVLGDYIQNFQDTSHPEKGYQTQCHLFNSALLSLLPQPELHGARKVSPNAYFWEAQRKLLAMSTSLERPLLVSGSGFRAIRQVLAGLPKNYNEIHSSIRHAQSWPPYLRPSDGMDENTYLEDNWSRVVGAGMLMQEAGFSKNETDEALDVLQGMAPDGTPTIQQRIMMSGNRKIGLWEASIKATRNANEAWGRFQNPPKEGMKPGADEYAAMLEKLSLRDKPDGSKALPGDKALNFPVAGRANLAEFEKARLLPPSVDELYKQMRMDRVQPNRRCMNILVAKAPSLEMANRYLWENSKGSPVTLNLISKHPDPEVLKETPLDLFSAYIDVLTQESQKTGMQMRRALFLADTRFKDRRSHWAGHTWGLVLKNLSQHHGAIRLSTSEQLKLLLVVADRIESSHGLNVAAFTQLNKCIKKIARRQLTTWWQSSNKAPLSEIYRQQPLHEDAEIEEPDEAQPKNAETDKVTSLLHKAAKRIKTDFAKLRGNEARHSKEFSSANISAMDRMLCRQDVITSEQVHEYALALAYLGEFDEVQRTLELMASEWGQPDVMEHLDRLDEQPAEADFFETLCVYRLLAEPMLGGEASGELRDAIASRGLGWTWPDEEALETYVDMRHDETLVTLRNVLDWAGER